MRYLFTALIMLCASLGFAQKITNVDFSVDKNNIIVTYDLSECQSCDIGLFISLDGGLTFNNSSLSPVSGDVGAGVTAGSKRMRWNPLVLYPNGIEGDVVFEVRYMGNVKGQKVYKTFNVDGVSFEVIYVEGGKFIMGATPEQGQNVFSDERPEHFVTLSDYYIGKTEVTQELWMAVMGNNPSNFRNNTWSPVENVSWYDVQTFLSRLSEITGYNFTLPTEAQWEYAARGGKLSKKYMYSGSNRLDDVAWYSDNSDNTSHLVRTKAPNELGIYNMSGNLAEWCSDWYGEYSSSPQTNPTGPRSGEQKVIRGGSSWNGGSACRISYRYKEWPSYATYTGFRVVLNQ